ncbi:MAG TPA: multidrug efflux RND transporter permease subunit, partial [Vicinamibacteria bacterium]|nr:multidrug efflux RND transporter permease subunit [Vicinamibacteria bacterium]
MTATDSGISATFIRRPVATSLLTAALFLAGALGFRYLPVAPLPQVDFPTISVSASLPGASPETMASAVATPLERQFGRIAGVTEMTSSSQLGSTGITLQFDLSRNIDAAARDVQAAINAARGQLPAGLPNAPNYRKVNPSDAPIMILALTSPTTPVAEMYDAGDSILAQKLAQVEGIGQVTVGGGARPAVRVEAIPGLLNSYGISLEQVRTVLANANANRPKGAVADGDSTWGIETTDQLFRAREYRNLLLTFHQGAAVRLREVATVLDSVEDRRTIGLSNGEPAVLLILYRQPGANIIETVGRVWALLPSLRASIPPSIHLAVALDRTTTIRASITDVERSLVISIVLVILVVFVFLRSVWATVIPSVAVPLSLVGTFGVMYLLGYSLDNLSLMALTISTGFVVDDAIVVIENIARYLEAGLAPLEAALRGSREIGFTVLSMSTSLVAVFIPILLMAGSVGRLFREFAVTLTVAILVSLVVSLTTTPMMCALFLRSEAHRRHGRVYRAAESLFAGLVRGYDRALRVVLAHQPAVLLVTLGTVVLSVYLFVVVPKGFFPQQDTGRLIGSLQAAQDVSFATLEEKLRAYVAIIREDPAVDNVLAFGGGGARNTARMFVQLKPLEERKLSADRVIARLRGPLAKVPGASLFLQPVQDVRAGGRPSSAQYQYTLQAPRVSDLAKWSQALLARMSKIPGVKDANTDQQDRGLEAALVVDRDTAARMGVSVQAVDDTLNDAFGQRPVSTIYKGLNQYRVVLEVAPEFQQSPSALGDVYVRADTGGLIPLSSFARYTTRPTALAVNHQGQFPSITLSFNLAPGTPLGDVVDRIEAAQQELGFPADVHGSFQGTAQAFQASLASQPLLILAALIVVYIVLGVLYESYIHPITILSTLPSAGVGALLALLLFKTDLNVIALIGILLLIGIVKKNAILMIDFAIQAERQEGKAPEAAIYEACLLRFRPILMTTFAALLGALPLAIGGGTGSELRQPLGITIVGGLLVSQLLTLFTTPVVYLYMDRLQARVQR